MVADARDAAPADRLEQAEPLEHGDARGHEALAARLLAREAVRVVNLDGEAGAAQHDREGGARRPRARDQDVGHVAAPARARPRRGTKRGFLPMASR